METLEREKTGFLKEAGDEGQLVIAFAREGDPQPDKDGDFFDVGSLRPMTGGKVPMAQFQHSTGRPMGVGTIGRDGMDATWSGQVNMKDPEAVATFEHVKAMGESQQYSFRFRSEKFTRIRGKGVRFHDAEVFEVSPVLMGAGNHTRTIEAKAAAGEMGHEGEGISGVESQALAILWEV